jgi:pyruvate formate lyase activating enzyme
MTSGPAPVGRRADDLVIAGLTPLSTCDWPGRLVATVFCQGCPWRCTYCHNPDLLDPRRPGVMGWPAVRDLLSRREGLLDGVVFSGGEPTMQAGLAAAMREVRAAGFGVALHTSGAYPRRLAEVLPLVDWVGLDVKAPADRYAAVTGVASSAERAFASLDLVLRAGVEVQVRTTVDPTSLTDGDVARLCGALTERGISAHIQQVRTHGVRPGYAEAFAASSGSTFART